MKKTKTIAMIAFFAWVSFFAPNVTEALRMKGVLMMGCLGLIFILGRIKKEDFLWPVNRMDVWLFFFLLAASCGVIKAKDAAIAYFHFWSFILPVPILYYFARTAYSEENSKLIMESLCLMAAFVSAYGLVEFFTKTNFLYAGGGVDNVFYRIFIGKRMASLHFHPTALGTYLAGVLPLAVGLGIKARKTAEKARAYLYVVFIFSGVVMTFSRGAMLAFIGSMITMILLCAKNKKTTFVLLLLSFCALIVIGVTAIALSRGSPYSHLTFARFGLSGLTNAGTYLRKIDRFVSVFKMLRDHPLCGIGLGQYRVLFDGYLPHLSSLNWLDKVPDLMYSAILAETGLLGFGSFVFFIFYLLKKSFRLLKKPVISDTGITLTSFIAGFVGIMISFLTYDGLYWAAPAYLFWSYSGILSYYAHRQQ